MIVVSWALYPANMKESGSPELLAITYENTRHHHHTENLKSEQFNIRMKFLTILFFTSSSNNT